MTDLYMVGAILALAASMAGLAAWASKVVAEGSEKS